MPYTTQYPTPLGPLTLIADSVGLSGLYFEGQTMRGLTENDLHREHDLPIFRSARTWLDAYFAGHEPTVDLPLHAIGTPFETDVWAILRTIRYGRTMTYGDIARDLARQRGIPRMSAQAVGGAVGRNPLSIVIPCHRVLGTGGRLTGYAGGLERKRALLLLEGIHEVAMARS